MIKFFRHIRRKLIIENGMSRYMFYALGEIILVVIGILIALQINNWNQNKIQKRQLEQILNIQSNDLKTDLENIDEVIAFYEELDSLLMDIIVKEYPESYFETINESNYAQSIHSVSRISIGRVFNYQKRGIKLLNRFVEFNNISEADLSQELTQFYANDIEKMEISKEVVLSYMSENFKYLEQFPWFKDYVIKKYNPETVRFFANDLVYKNKAASFLVVAVRTYLRDLKKFRIRASEIIEKIEQEL